MTYATTYDSLAIEESVDMPPERGQAPSYGEMPLGISSGLKISGLAYFIYLTQICHRPSAYSKSLGYLTADRWTINITSGGYLKNTAQALTKHKMKEGA